MLCPGGVDRLAQLTVCISDLRIDVTLRHPFRATSTEHQGLLALRSLGETASSVDGAVRSPSASGPAAPPSQPGAPAPRDVRQEREPAPSKAPLQRNHVLSGRLAYAEDLTHLDADPPDLLAQRRLQYLARVSERNGVDLAEQVLGMPQHPTR